MKKLLSIYPEFPPIRSDVVMLLMIAGDDSSYKRFASTVPDKKNMLESWREGGDSLFVVYDGKAYDPEEGEMEYIIQGMSALECEV
jgi:hypothetical protein